MAQHWHILGAGAMGCLFASALKKVQAEISMILREPRKDDRATITVDADGDSRSVSVQTTSAAQLAANNQTITHLLLTTKAYDAATAFDSVKNSLAENARVLLLVNGMGLQEQLSAQRPGVNISCGTTTEGAYRKGEMHIEHAGHGTTCIGQQGVEQAPTWFSDWSNAIESCVWDSNIEAALWHKLAVNCAINPLTALHGCRNGELASGSLVQQVEQLCAEISQISYAAGYTRTAQTIGRSAMQVIQATANNRSSMLQDILNGSATEIDHITGYLLQVANRHGIPAPLNTRLLEEIKRDGC